MFFPELLTIFKVGLNLAHPLVVESISQNHGREHRPQGEGPGHSTSKRSWSPASPLGPRFRQTSIGDATKR